MAGQPVCMDILSSASLALNEASGSASAVASSSSFNFRRGDDLHSGSASTLSSSTLSRFKQRTASEKFMSTDIKSLGRFGWDFPGWGTSSEMNVKAEELKEFDLKETPHYIGQIPATAICGNDILSSCLYVSGLTALVAGKLAPLALLLVALMLNCYRSVYGEVVTALPTNGGVFNALIHTSSKPVAAFASIFSILTYIATSVVSAISAVEYLNYFVIQTSGGGGDVDHPVQHLPTQWITTGLLCTFALLTFMGLRESTVVATGIFTIHLATLTTLIVTCIVYGFNNNWTILVENMSLPYPAITLPSSGVTYQNAWMSLLMGFSTASLGITGFETSAQFVEEQAPGVFRKTLRNMLVGIAVFNPTISILCFTVLPFDRIVANSTYLLAEVGMVAGGTWLFYLVSIDAFLVLSGAVLTAYVGVVGLIRQVASDKCLPNFLLSVNSCRGTTHWIIFGFCALSVSLLWILGGDETVLAGVYAVSFLTVMLLFSLACALLKMKRPDLPREVKASWFGLLLGAAGVFLSLIGNILQDPDIVLHTLTYFLGVGFLVLVMYQRVTIAVTVDKLYQAAQKSLKANFKVNFPSCCHSQRVRRQSTLHTSASRRRVVYDVQEKNCFEKMIQELRDYQTGFICEHTDLAQMNRAVLYNKRNETSDTMIFILLIEPDPIIVDEDDDLEIHFNRRAPFVNEDLFKENVSLLDNMYPEIRINSLIVRKAALNIATINYLSTTLGIPRNYIFISSSEHLDMKQLGGVRIIQ